MFIIYVLSFNKFNITIHSNIKFMVTTYNQNLHFRIHYKKSKNKTRSHLIITGYYKKSTQKMNIKFTIEVCVFLYYQKTFFKIIV
jgi:hypothetical protein